MLRDVNPKNIYTRENSLKWEEKNSLSCLISRPIVMDLVADLAQNDSTRLLDVGCGTGRWTKQFAQHCLQVAGIDIVEANIKICKEKNSASNITYEILDMFSMRGFFFDESFNIATALMVVQYAKDQVSLKLLFKEIGYLLSPGSDFIFLIPHPTGIMMKKSKWAKYCYGKNASYFENFRFTGEVRLTDNDWKKVGAYHYSISDYFNALINAGFETRRVFEPQPTEDLIAQYPDMANDAKVPMTLIVHSKKCK